MNHNFSAAQLHQYAKTTENPTALFNNSWCLEKDDDFILALVYELQTKMLNKQLPRKYFKIVMRCVTHSQDVTQNRTVSNETGKVTDFH